MNSKKIILVTGVSGSGKTFVSKYLSEKYKVFHFDDIDIKEYGGAKEWQRLAVHKWVKKLLVLKESQTLILEGAFNPEFAVAILQENLFYNYKILCFNAGHFVRENRLIRNRMQSELVNQDMENFAMVLRDKTIEYGGAIIDTNRDIHEIVQTCLEEIEGIKSSKMIISVEMAISLIKEQFPQYADLAIMPVKHGGWDNATFHLGSEMLIRIPRGSSYALKVTKEQKILHRLRGCLSLEIPKPIHIGHSSSFYPWSWSIYKYLDGNGANAIKIFNKDLDDVAFSLGRFLNELHDIDVVDMPLPGLHNYWRGEHIGVYENGALSYFNMLRHFFDRDKLLSIWKRAAITKWQKPPLCIHGDLTSANILMKDGKLSAVIDFGGFAKGDPACDLTIAWTFFKDTSREIFRKRVGLDDDTWLRAKAWTLWKASFELVNIKNKSSKEALEQIRVIKEVIES